MKLEIILTLIISSVQIVAQNNAILGYVSLQNSTKTPISNVEVYALGANIAYTNHEGYFRLVFDKKRPGDVINVIEFSLDGYLVVNEKECHNLVIPRDPSFVPLHIVMAEKRSIKENRAKYYDIIVDQVNEKYKTQLGKFQKAINDLEKESLNSQVYKAQRDMLLIRIKNLQEEKDRAIANSERLAETFVQINRDNTSPIVAEALKKFEEGRLQDAIAILEEKKLEEEMNVAQELTAIEVDKQKLQQQAVQNYMLKARLLTAGFQLDEAYQNYLYAIQYDSTNVEHLSELANFCDRLNKQDLSITYFKQALRHSAIKDQQASIHNNLGNQYRYINRYDKARSAYLKALNIYKQLALENSKRFEPLVAATLNNLGILYTDLNDYSKSERAYLEALEIYQRLVMSSPEQFQLDVATTLNNLGNMYVDLNAYNKAEEAYLKALEIRRQLAMSNPEQFELDVATTLNNLGNMYADLNAYGRAEEAYLKSLEIRRRLAMSNPERFEPDVATTLNNLGNMYADLNAYDKAEEAYLEALEIRRRLAMSNPERFELDKAMVQNNLGTLYYNLNEYEKAQAAYLEALKIRRRLAQSNPERFERDVANILNNLGIMFGNLNAYDKAEEAYAEALEIRKRLAKTNPERYEPDVAMTQNNLGIMYKNLKAYDKAEEAYAEALEIRKRLAKTNPERYEPDVAMTQNNLGIMYESLKAYDKAEEAYAEALETRKRLAKTNPERYEPDVAMTQNNLGIMYESLKAYDKAEEAYAEALEIRKRLAKTNPERYEPDVAMTQNSLGLMNFSLGKAEKAMTFLDQSLAIYQKQAKKSPQVYDLEIARTLMIKAFILIDQRKHTTANEVLKEAKSIAEKYPYVPFSAIVLQYFEELYQDNIPHQQALEIVQPWHEQMTNLASEAEKVPLQKQILAVFIEVAANHPENQAITAELSNAFGGLAWNQLFANDFAAAEQSARKGLEIDPSQQWINTNLALSLLFQGKYEEAETIYQNLRDKPYNGDLTWTEVFLADLIELENAGVVHPDVDKIRKILQQ